MPFTVPAVTACPLPVINDLRLAQFSGSRSHSHELEIAGLTATIRGYNPVSPILQALAVVPEQAQA
jgi:hypothetical protein